MVDNRVLCDVCGNEIVSRVVRCPFCKSERPKSLFKGGRSSHRVVNLEQGMPPVADAVRRLKLELESSRLQGEKVIVFIHGYGSSGKGGAIKKEVRRLLSFMLAEGKIKEVVAGESLLKRSGRERNLFKRFSFLAADRSYYEKNPGITIVLLSNQSR